LSQFKKEDLDIYLSNTLDDIFNLTYLKIFVSSSQEECMETLMSCIYTFAFYLSPIVHLFCFNAFIIIFYLQRARKSYVMEQS
jgi:hypothetical protein